MSDNPVKWTAAGLTPAGNALQAALLGTGDGLTFTRAVAADAEGVERLDLTLQSPCTVDGPKCRVPVLLTNSGVENGFTMTELRFYVRRVTDGAPTGEEVLYATVTDETGDPIPTAAQSPGFTIDWAFVFQYGNAGSVTVTLDPVGLVSIGMVGRPGGVAALGDNGAVPVSQGGTGETTVQGVADAFGIFLAISAAAAYDPEGSYAVGDYCTHGGKLHKCNTPIPSGEAWNPAHWTETTVAAELAEVRTALSNRLSNQYTDRVQIPDGSDFATFMVDKPYGYYYVSGEDLVEGMPTNDLVWWFIWHVPSGIFAVSAYTNELFRAEFTNNHLWAWRKIAFCDKPQEFDLPLAEGFTNGGNASTYWKDQFGVVHVEFCVQKSGSTYETADVFATLPAGFRPKRRVQISGIGDGIAVGNGIIAMEAYIEPNGSMHLYHANSNIQWVVGERSFLAAD